MEEYLAKTIKRIKRLAIITIGFTVLLIGVLMIATPAPGIVVILVGLGILSTELLWAERLLKKVKNKISGSAGKS